jgi:NADH dehydrogenase
LPVVALLGFHGTFDDQAIAFLPGWAVSLLYGTIAGSVIGLIGVYRPRGVAVAASGGVLIGLLGWLLFSLSVDPLLHGRTPTWSAEAAGAAYRNLVAGLLHGGMTGVVLHGLLTSRGFASRICDLARAWWHEDRLSHRHRVHEPPVLAQRAGRRRPGRTPAESTPLSRVVIIGGGFAGVSAARRFERLALRGAPVDVTLISDSNFMLFTPMLAEVASGAVEPSHISVPVRAAVANTRFRQGTVEDIEAEARIVHLASRAGPAEQIPYDHLVLAVGSVPNFLDLPGVREYAHTLKSLNDATVLRNHVLGLLEQADHIEPDPLERERLLTFVVAGGGFAGAEIAAELFDLVHAVLHYFPGIAPDEPRFVVVHGEDRILPELPSELGAYALSRLRARGIEFRLGVLVAEGTAKDVLLSNGDRISAGTFVWTAGNRPSPLVASLAGEHARNGALVTDHSFRVSGLDRVWAVGDCAQIPDIDRAGAPFPPTAQHAQRQGRVVADNIADVIAGRQPTSFRFRTIGVLVALGHRTAAAEIRGHRFSGLGAWLLWRGVYLSKLPGIEKRVRVLFDWTLDLVFPRDIVVAAPPAASVATARSTVNGNHR